MSTLPHAVTALAASPDGTTLAIGLAKGALIVWDMVAGQVRADRLQRGNDRLNALCFSPDGTRLAIAADDGGVTTWDTQDCRPCERFDLPGGRALAVAFSPDGTQLATVGETGFPHVLSTRDGSLLFADTGKHPDGRGCALAFSDERLLVGFGDGVLGHWLRLDRAPWFETPKGARFAEVDLYAVCVARQRKITILGLNSGGGVLFLRAPQSGDWPGVARIKVPRPMAVNALAMPSDESLLAAACSDGVVRLHTLTKIPSAPMYDGAPNTLVEITLGREVHQGWTPRAIVSSVAFLATDVLASGHFDGSVRFWKRHPSLDTMWMPRATLRCDETRVLLTGDGTDETPLSWASSPLRRA